MTGPGSLAGQRCLVVGGAGAVGRMVVELLLGAGASVCVVDPAPPVDPAPAVDAAPAVGPAAAAGGTRPGYRHLRSDITAIDGALAAELGRAEIVVLAVPEPVALAAVPSVAAAMGPGALLVDTLSVKGPIAAAVGRAGGRLEALSLNPMFAPSLGIAGRAVAAVVVHDGPRTQGLLDLVRQRGGRVVELSADEHDELAAATQALTHATVLAFGLALAELEVDVDDLTAVAPPPHATLLALLARITSGAPETYWDVQAANRHADRARAALAGGLRRLAEIVDGGDVEEFAAALDRLRGALGGEAARYRDLCEHLFRAMQAAPSATDRLTNTNDERVKP